MSNTQTDPATGPLKLNFLSHGTLESTDLEKSRQFYEEFLGLEVIVEKRSALLHSFGGGQHRLEDFVLDVDQGDGLLCNVRAGRGDGRDGVTRVENLAAGEHVISEADVIVDREFNTVLVQMWRRPSSFHSAVAA